MSGENLQPQNISIDPLQFVKAGVNLDEAADLTRRANEWLEDLVIRSARAGGYGDSFAKIYDSIIPPAMENASFILAAVSGLVERKGQQGNLAGATAADINMDTAQVAGSARRA